MRRFITVVFILLFAIINLHAQFDSLSLKKAIEIAYKQNPDINKLQASINEKKEQWRLVSGVNPPEFRYSKEGLSQNNNSFDEQRFSVSQSFDFPTTTIYRLQALKDEMEALNYKLKANKRDLKAMVKDRYIEVLFSLYTTDLMNKKIELADQLYNTAYSRQESGIGNGMEVLNAEIRKAEARNDLDDAQTRLHQSRYSLFNVIGLKIKEQHYGILFSDTLRTHNERIDQKKALNYLEKQPEYLSAKMQWEAAGKKLKEARSNILPDISLGYFIQDYGSGFDFHGFEVGLKLPLWIPLQYKGEIRTAQAQRTRLQWEQVRVKLMMKKEIENAWHGFENSVTTINRFDKTIRSKAEQLQKLTYEGYRIGEINLLSLLDAQQTYLRSQQRYLDALRNHYKQLVNLEKYIGEEIVY